MPVELPTPKSRNAIRGRSRPSPAAMAVMLVGAGTGCAVVSILPAPLVLPAIGVLATLAAALVALLARVMAQRVTDAVTCWDIAGALTLIGIVATLLSEPELVLPYLHNQTTE